MEDRWNQLEDWLEDNAPELLPLRPPATEAEIREAEAAIGSTFPPSVRQSYRVHDGEAKDSCIFGVWRLLPLDDIVEEVETMRERERKFEFGDWDTTAWIPILYNNGDILYVEDAPEGAETPVVEWWHENPSRDVQAPSFRAYFDSFLEDLAAGEYVYQEFGRDVAGLVHESELGTR